jgi:hypothetical protein
MSRRFLGWTLGALTAGALGAGIARACRDESRVAAPAAPSVAHPSPNAVGNDSPSHAPISRSPAEQVHVPNAAPSSSPPVAPDAPAPRIQIVGRAIDPDGFPLADAKLRCRILQLEQDASLRIRACRSLAGWSDLDTDSAGRFAVTLNSRTLENSGSHRFQLERTSRKDDAWRGSTSLPDEDPVHDVGDVRLAPRRVLVSGSVVDTTGRPLPGVLVFATASSARLGDLEPGLQDSMVGSTRADGTFELQGWEGAVNRRILASDPHWKQDGDVEIAPPAEGVQVVMRVSDEPILSVRIVLNDEPQRHLHLDLRRHGEPGSEPAAVAHARWDGSYYFRPLEPGEYDLAVYDAWTWVQLDRIERILVEPNRPVQEPRVAPWDLSDKVRRMRVRLVDDLGNPMTFARVALESDDPPGHELQADRDGWCTLLLPIQAPASRVVDAFGHARELVDGASIIVRRR